MPFINLKTTEKISKFAEKELSEEFGRLIELLPGKSDFWLMQCFEGEARMTFRSGKDEPTAMIEVSVFGKAPADCYERLTAALTSAVSKKLNVSPDRIYVKYTECDTWGYNGSNF